MHRAGGGETRHDDPSYDMTTLSPFVHSRESPHQMPSHDNATGTGSYQDSLMRFLASRALSPTYRTKTSTDAK